MASGRNIAERSAREAKEEGRQLSFVVFRDLATAHVRVIDVSTGMASDSAGARIQFGALALVNDTMLQTVRSETLRGLEGRALAGFWAGGRVYGYRTVREESPRDPEHPRAVPVIDEIGAAVVRRILQLYADSHGLKQIASLLNAEGVPAPYGRVPVNDGCGGAMVTFPRVSWRGP